MRPILVGYFVFLGLTACSSTEKKPGVEEQPKATKVEAITKDARPDGKSENVPTVHAAPTLYVVQHNTKDQTQVEKIAEARHIESFVTAGKSYTVFEAPSKDILETELKGNAVAFSKITLVKDINSPVRGGGEKAGASARDGHTTFVIERAIPGVGSFPDEKKAKISAKSNKAIAEIGDSIEWDHSYLTDEGTYCIYRAENETAIRKHSELSGAPITSMAAASSIVQVPSP